MLTIESNSRHFYPTLDMAATLAYMNNEASNDWTYVAETQDNGKTWSVAIYDEDAVKVGYL